MCFSATASFVAGGILIPLGGVALAQAWKTDRRYLTFAAFPALFGIQQIFEGFLWRSMEDPGVPASHAAAMAFLLFAYLLWPVLTPLALFLIEDRTWLRRVFLGVTVFGGAYGLLLFAPLVVNPDWLSVELARNSILYNPQPIYGDLVSNTVLRVIYAAVICLPLFASTAPGVRVFGVLVTLSVLLTFLFATYAFTSIWCYLAAVVSAYIAVLMFRLRSPVGARRIIEA